MDPMDYTMDEAGNHGNQGNNSAGRYQCQQSSPPTQNGFSSQSRDASHFDPVHDASNYYYGYPGTVPVRMPHTTPYMQQMQHWGAPPSIPGAGWQAFGDMSRPSPSQGGPGRNYGDMSWGPSRGFGRSEEVYGPFSNQLSGHNLSSDNSMVPGGNGVAGSAGQPSALRPRPYALNFDQQIPELPSTPGSSHNRVSSFGSGRTNRHQNPSHSFPEPPPYLSKYIRIPTRPNRTHLTFNPGYQRVPRASLSRPAFNGSTASDRRSWADSDEDSISDLENEAVRREVALYRENNDEHALLMQGAMAAGRRMMMAKEAFNSLEKIKLKDLPKESKGTS